MPAPFEIRLEVFGDEILSRTLLRMGDRATNMRPVWPGVAARLRNAASRQFATQGRFGSGGWKPIDPAYRAEKLRQGLDGRILQATHALRDSLTRMGDPNHIEERTRDSLRWGSRVPYGKYHRKTRPPIQLPAVVRVAIVKDVQRHIVETDRS